MLIGVRLHSSDIGLSEKILLKFLNGDNDFRACSQSSIYPGKQGFQHSLKLLSVNLRDTAGFGLWVFVRTRRTLPKTSASCNIYAGGSELVLGGRSLACGKKLRDGI